MHLKRQKVPKSWPIPRKGTKYVVRAKFNMNEGIPILVFLRDMLKIAQNRKEIKKALYKKHILLNEKPVKSEKNSLLLFDKITIIPSKKYYNLNLSKFGKFEADEVQKAEVGYKIAKIRNKKTLKGKKIQLNLSDGRNVLSDIRCNVNDSIIFDFKEKKITKCLPLKENSKIIIFSGKHTGKRGSIIKINSEKKMAELEIDKKKVNVLIKQVMVIE
ncbi:MAG: hypothetical protein ABIH59_00240 [archaeon]